MERAADTIWTVIIGVVILAIIFMLVRPSPSGGMGPAGKAIVDVTGALAVLISTATNNFGGSNPNE
jgi:hypothetical protein